MDSMRSDPQPPGRIDTPAAQRSANDEQASTSSKTLAMLDIALATELTSLLRCRRHHFMLLGAGVRAVAVALLVHSVGAQRNADGIAGRIVDLGGAPDFSPDGVSRRSCTPYRDDTVVDAMILDTVRAERAAAGFYQTLLEHLGDNDAKTSRLVRSILQGSRSFADALESSPLTAPSPA